MTHKFAACLYLVCLTSLAQGQATIKPAGISGSAGAGFINWQIVEPDLQFKVNQGQFLAISGEKGFDFFNLYLNLTLSYLSTTGNVNYRYSTINGIDYSADNVAFKADLFQAGLGLKWKIIDGYWIRPYVEGGGTGGYFTLKYQDVARKLTSGTGTDFRNEDSLLDFGKYAEAGLEITFSNKFGIRPAARMLEGQTKEFDTLNKKSVIYRATIYYFSLLASF